MTRELICEKCHCGKPAKNPGKVKRYRLRGARLSWVLCEEHRAHEVADLVEMKEGERP